MRVPGVEALREALAGLGLDSRGHKDVLKKRLRAAGKRDEREGRHRRHLKALRDARTRPVGQDFDSYLVLDFEATCQRHEPKHGDFFGFPNEIIEFPVWLLQWRRKVPLSSEDSLDKASDSRGVGDNRDEDSGNDSGSPVSLEGDNDDEGDSQEDSSEPSTSSLERRKNAEDAWNSDSDWELVHVDTFRRFVRPTWRPVLSNFCKELTGISQADIDASPTFPEVLNEFEETFMAKYRLFTSENKTAWVTDGPWDLRDFAAKQLFISGLAQRPAWLGGGYIDLRASATMYFSREAGKAASEAIPVKTEVESIQVDQNAEPVDITFQSIPPRSPEISAPLPLSIVKPVAVANIPSVLEALGLPPFEGQLHSGIDDVRNIARILVELAMPHRGWRVVQNAHIRGREKTWKWMRKGGKIAWEHPPEA